MGEKGRSGRLARSASRLPHHPSLGRLTSHGRYPGIEVPDEKVGRGHGRFVRLRCNCHSSPTFGFWECTRNMYLKRPFYL